ncbi:MAG TPA: tachylectin-related carbohydrate-binding protein [Natronosporangium sp.]
MNTTTAPLARRALGGLLGLTMLASLLVAIGASANAAPATPHFPPSIDGYAAYDPQDTCSGSAKPGVVDFKNLLNATYGSHTWGIVRACGDGGTSEHKEGRALDYHFNYNNATDRAKATDLLNWLLATDQYGNRHAMVRRLGIMYIIWNRQIWEAYRPSAGWQPYRCDGSPSSCHTNHIHFSFSWAGAQRRTTWWTAAGPQGLASVYGVLPDGRLTYTIVDATGRRTYGAVTSQASLGFTPQTLATLNFNTLLVTDTDGNLYRIDIGTNNGTVTFNPPVRLGGGWTHRLLAYDGNGHLYGIAGENHTLIRYTINATKPTTANISGRTEIGRGFSLKTLTTTGPDWLLGNHPDGRLIAYHITGPGQWNRFDLRGSTWQVFDQLTSPGGGVYLAHKPDGSMTYYLDRNPHDGNGTDITSAKPVDPSGWTQTLLSAQPGTIH